MNPHEVVWAKWSATAAFRFDSFLLKALVNRVKRRICIRMLRMG